MALRSMLLRLDIDHPFYAVTQFKNVSSGVAVRRRVVDRDAVGLGLQPDGAQGDRVPDPAAELRLEVFEVGRLLDGVAAEVSQHRPG